MDTNEIILTATTALTAIAGAWGVARGWIAKFKLNMELKAQEFILYLQEKIEAVVQAVDNLNKTGEEKKTQAMKMMQEYVLGKHEKWITWEHIISARIEDIIALANKIGHGTKGDK